MNAAELYQQHNASQVERGKRLVEQAGVTLGQSVLDIGCGTGELTAHLLECVGPAGQVHGIDPDGLRLELAAKVAPRATFSLAGIEDFRTTEPFDVLFSNYAYHWLEDKLKGIAGLKANLKVGGLLAMNFITRPSPINKDLKALHPAFDSTFEDTYPLMSAEEFLSHLKVNHFEVVGTYPVDDYTFDSLDDFLSFWEAVTSSRMRPGDLSQEAYGALKEKYPGTIACYGQETLSLIAQRVA